jgi:hypothetical protein
MFGNEHSKNPFNLNLNGISDDYEIEDYYKGIDPRYNNRVYTK